MKKLIACTICILTLALGLQAQTNKWFVSFSMGYCIGGPGSSMKNTFTDQGFDYTSSGIFGFGSATYPISRPIPSLIFMAGKQITKYGSLYLVIGQPAAGTVDGYNGYYNVSFDYNVLQFTLGYQFSFPDTRFRVGLGPSLFIFKNTPVASYQSLATQSSTIPGATVTARMPFGPEKKLFGVELFFQMNLAPSANLGGVQIPDSEFPASKVSMTNAIIGITFAFRG